MFGWAPRQSVQRAVGMTAKLAADRRGIECLRFATVTRSVLSPRVGARVYACQLDLHARGLDATPQHFRERLFCTLRRVQLLESACATWTAYLLCCGDDCDCSTNLNVPSCPSSLMKPRCVAPIRLSVEDYPRITVACLNCWRRKSGPASR